MKKTSATIQKLTDWVKNNPELLLCILFGSTANNQENRDSDLDVAIACEAKLNIIQKQQFIEELALTFGRPVDLIDLQTVSGTLLHQVLTEGTLVNCRDHQLYAEIIKQMLFNQHDFMPYHHRILKERRERWINE